MNESEPLGSASVEVVATSNGKWRKRRGRDGLFQRNGWWWIDYSDADGKRHRHKAAPDYQTARMIYRDTVSKIARGEVVGVREEGIRLKDFTERKYWARHHADPLHLGAAARSHYPRHADPSALRRHEAGQSPA